MKREEDQRPEHTHILHLKSSTLTELAAIYQVDRRTFRKWLRPFLSEIGERVGRYYTVRQVQLIMQMLGTPEYFNPEEKH